MKITQHTEVPPPVAPVTTVIIELTLDEATQLRISPLSK